MRIDKVLVELGHCRSRTQSHELIDKGLVYYDGVPIKRASFKVIDPTLIEVKTSDDLNLSYVGRGAYKLKKAIETFGLELRDKIVADVGASTGGFTQVLLEHGVKRVYAIDVGTGQLHSLLVEDERVVNMEQTHIEDLLQRPLVEKVDMVVVDLSFISLTKCTSSLCSLLKENGEMVLLIKPQFEVGKQAIGKNGLVKDQKEHLKALSQVHQSLKEHRLGLISLTWSPIRGKTGNQEYLFYARKDQEDSFHDLFEDIIQQAQGS